jgi:hypothetical protein
MTKSQIPNAKEIPSDPKSSQPAQILNGSGAEQSLVASFWWDKRDNAGQDFDVNLVKSRTYTGKVYILSQEILRLRGTSISTG